MRGTSSVHLLTSIVAIFCFVATTSHTLFGESLEEETIGIIDKLETQFYFFRQGSGNWTVYRGTNAQTYCNGNSIITNWDDVVHCYKPLSNGSLELKFSIPAPYEGSRRIACDVETKLWLGMQVFNYERGDVRFHRFKLEDGKWTDIRPLAISGDEFDLDYGTGQGFRPISGLKRRGVLFYSAGRPKCVIVATDDVIPVFKSANSVRADTTTLDTAIASSINEQFGVFELEASRVKQEYIWTFRHWDTNIVDWEMIGPRVLVETSKANYELSNLGSASIVNGSTAYLDNDLSIFFSRFATVSWSNDGQRFTKLSAVTPEAAGLLGMFQLSGQLYLVAADEKEKRFWIAETNTDILTKPNKFTPNWTEATFVDVAGMTVEMSKGERRKKVFWLRLAATASTLVSFAMALMTYRSIRRSRSIKKSRSS